MMLQKALQILLIVLRLLHVRCPQSPTFDSLSQNFCLVTSGERLPDNLSCPNDPIEVGQCLRRSQLCNGVNDCGDTQFVGSDEGDATSLTALECK